MTTTTSDPINWRRIANHLYDELRVRGVSEGGCRFNHENLCGCQPIDCIDEYERASSIEGGCA